MFHITMNLTIYRQPQVSVLADETPVARKRFGRWNFTLSDRQGVYGEWIHDSVKVLETVTFGI